jgi:hypothetical protein
VSIRLSLLVHNNRDVTNTLPTDAQHSEDDFVAVALKNAHDERRAKPDMQNENTEEDVGTSG